MDDLLRQLLGYARGAWSYRWWGLAVAWVVGAGAAIGVYLLPDKYEASARIYVDTQSVLGPLMAGLAVPTDVNQQVVMLSKTLISRPNTEKLIRMADLDLAAKTKKQKDDLVDDVIARIKINGVGKDNLFTLRFMDDNPERAKRVVQSMVSIFVESGLGDKRKDTDTARRFIEEQIKNYASKLDEAETRLKEFKLKNMALLGGEGAKDSIGQMGDLSSKLRQAQLELREAENSRDAVKKQLVGETPSTSISGPAGDTIAIPELDGRIDAQKKQLDELLRRYTEDHPDVKGTRRVLELLEKQREEELKVKRAAAVSNPLSVSNPNPVYQQLRISLTENEARIASLRTRVAEFEARLAQSREAMKLGPQIEQEFAQLNRDYEIHKKNYDSLVARRESATISVDMDAATGVAEFRLIDPPSVPSRPAWPNRLLLMPISGVVALLVGLAVSLLISQLRPAFFDSRSLRESTGMPILGSISMTPNPDRARRERRTRYVFAGGVAALVCAFFALTILVAAVGRIV